MYKTEDSELRNSNENKSFRMEMLIENIRQMKTSFVQSSWQKLPKFYPMTKQSNNSLSNSKLKKRFFKESKRAG